MDMETAAIWDEFSERIHAFIRSTVGRSEDAEDLLQEVFVKIHGKLHTLANAEKVESWIYQITRNAINDYYRKSGRGKEELANWQISEVEMSKESSNVESHMEQCLLPFVQHLPEKYRQAIELSELKGMKQREVAAHLNISLSGAKSRVQRGREMLKQLFIDCCHFQQDDKGYLIGAPITLPEDCPICNK